MIRIRAEGQSTSGIWRYGPEDKRSAGFGFGAGTPEKGGWYFRVRWSKECKKLFVKLTIVSPYTTQQDWTEPK